MVNYQSTHTGAELDTAIAKSSNLANITTIGGGLSLSNGTLSVTGVPYLTTAPSANNTDGLKFVVLSSEPSAYYTGYYYIITGA